MYVEWKGIVISRVRIFVYRVRRQTDYRETNFRWVCVAILLSADNGKLNDGEGMQRKIKRRTRAVEARCANAVRSLACFFFAASRRGGVPEGLKTEGKKMRKKRRRCREIKIEIEGEREEGGRYNERSELERGQKEKSNDAGFEWKRKKRQK